jgi:hypothetical protein
MISVVILSAIMLSVNILNVIMIRAIILSVIIHCAIILSAIILSVVILRVICWVLWRHLFTTNTSFILSVVKHLPGRSQERSSTWPRRRPQLQTVANVIKLFRLVILAVVR